jgi:transposase
MVKTGPRRQKQYVTAIVDVEKGQLLDIAPDRKCDEATSWLRARGAEWLTGVTADTLDLFPTTGVEVLRMQLLDASRMVALKDEPRSTLV